jgi:hypothetical protein
LAFPGDHGIETGVWTIISCTDHKLILDSGGHKVEYMRYSADCQKKP